MSNEIKEKEEYEKYARDHRKELDAQEVKLGDVVTVLVGHFAGEKGVIVGMIACDKSDYADPYYEIEMGCDVPEEFRVRKTLIGQSRVIGGVEKRYLKVIGNRAPKQPSMNIKQGDRVRVSKDAPKMYMSEDSILPLLECEVLEVETDNARIEPKDPDGYFFKPLVIPTKYLVKVDAKAKEAKFKAGDKVCYNGYVYEIEGLVGKNRYALKGLNFDLDENMIDPYEPYTEPTTPTIKDGERVRNIESGLIGVVDKIVYGNVAWVNGVDGKRYHWKSNDLELVQPTEQTEAEKKPNIGSIKIPVEVDLTDSYWDAYTADLARDIAVKSMEKSYGCDPERIADYAVSVAKAVAEGLKGK